MLISIMTTRISIRLMPCCLSSKVVFIRRVYSASFHPQRAKHGFPAILWNFSEHLYCKAIFCGMARKVLKQTEIVVAKNEDKRRNAARSGRGIFTLEVPRRHLTDGEGMT